MRVFGSADFDDHEQVTFFADPGAGLRAIVAIHRSGPLGIAGGGCRMWPYASEDEALRDALRLSRAMTYKLALAGLPAGGAKAVVLGDPARDKTDALLEALGRAVDGLGGRYVIAEDVGTTPRDLQVIARATAWVRREAGDTAEGTALGVLRGLEVAVRRRLGATDLRGVSVAVQGLGRVGRRLCAHLARTGARLVVADLDPARARAIAAELEATAVGARSIYDQAVEVFAPCALGGVLDDATIPRLRCAVVAGSANAPLAEPRHADVLAARGVLYAPDIVIGAGGVLAAASGDDARALAERLDGLAATLEAVFARAERERITPLVAAERTARERLEAGP